MKNPSMAKLAKMAGSNRVAMKMKMEEKAAAKMKKEAAMKLKKESMAKQKIDPFGKKQKGPFAEGLEKDVTKPPKTVAAPKKSFKQAYKDRDMKIYGDLTFDEYKAEAKRQIKSKKEGKGFDAPKKPMTSTKKNQTTTTTTTTTTKPTDTKKKETTTTTTPTETKKKKGKFLKDTKVGKEIRRFGQSLKDLLTKKKPSATKMKKKSAMEMKKEAAMKMKKKAAMKMKKEASMKMKKEAAMKMKKKGAMKMKKAPTKMKKASMAKLNPGFDKLPKEVQAKILKKKKK